MTLLFVSACAFGTSPVLFYSDLDSGPGTGGENNAGVFICVYGRNFGATRGTSTITVGGVPASNYKFWGSSGLPTSTDKACFQMGSGTPAGAQSVVLTVGGASSNTLSFTVRNGNIYFLDPANASGVASDSNPGTINAPWLTYDKATHAMSAGDTTYVRASVITKRSAASARGVIVPYGSGVPGGNKALVAYPGETVVVGQDDTLAVCSGSCHGIYSNSQFVSLANYWTISGIEAHGYDSAAGFVGGAHIRFVANRASCPNENNWLACVYFSQQDNDLQVYGNEVFNVGTSVTGYATKGTHHMYFGTDDYNLEAGWNYIHDGHACRGIQIHSSPINGGGTNDPTGNNLYNLSIHDNWIENVGCDGINFATVDPSKGPVVAYNNIFKHVGTGLHSGDSSDYAAILVAGITNRQIVGTGTWSATTATNAIVGVGTAFTRELKPGWSLYVTATGDSWSIQSIQDDTHATAYPTPHAGNVAAGTQVVYRQDGVGNVRIYNNTAYDTAIVTTSGAFSRTYSSTYSSPALTMYLENNIVYAINGEHFLSPGYGGRYVAGTNNLWYGGADAPPAQTLKNIASNPLFVSPGADFHLQSGSPAVNAGSSANYAISDFDGAPRLVGSITPGAYTAPAGLVTKAFNACDLNQDGVVDSTDIRMAVDEAIGKTACGNAALVYNPCSVVSVQRIINAAMGGACVTGQ